MSTHLGWEEVLLRLALTIGAGALIGFDRGEHGRPAGLRTTILVCLAASVSMIQVNLLLSLSGKTSDSFVVLDLMRLPLGILSGMGFIGGGAILRRGDMVLGVTTAATLWFVTVMGLCFGGGQLALGLAMLGSGLCVLTLLRWAEDRMSQDRRATLTITMDREGPSENELRHDLLSEKYRIVSFAVAYAAVGVHRVRCVLQWRDRADDTHTPALVQRISQRPGVLRVEWRPA